MEGQEQIFHMRKNSALYADHVPKSEQHFKRPKIVTLVSVNVFLSKFQQQINIFNFCSGEALSVTNCHLI